MVGQVEVPTVALASSVTGFLLCDIGEVYRVIEQMTGIAPYTHQLPRMGRELAAHVKQHLPDFPDEGDARDFPVNRETVHAYADALVERFGETVAVPRLVSDRRDPAAELVDMVGEQRVIVVSLGDSEDAGK
jgi:hypothetical protein